MMRRAGCCSPLLLMGLMLKADPALSAGAPPTTGNSAPTTMYSEIRPSLCKCRRPSPATPPPPAATILYLELVVNGLESGEVVPVQVRDNRFYVAPDALQRQHVRVPNTNDKLVALDQIPEMSVEYDSTGQQLRLQLPPAWLPAQELGAAQGLRPWDATSDPGFLLNYDIYAHDLTGSQTPTQASAWTELRFFGNWGVLSNTGINRNILHEDRKDYLRYDTRWTWSDPETVRTLTAGDLITGALPWGNAVRLGGIQIARNFAVRPDLVPYPLPRFSGQATLPSSVDLFINGYKAGSDAVQPGPFTLNTMPFINGAGEATVVTTDALGRRSLTTLPFYISNTLLKPGTTDYALAFGALREDYGIRNFSYGEAAYSATYRRGMDQAWTMEGRAEGVRKLTALGAGSVFTLRQYGVVNLSLTASLDNTEQTPRQGQQWSYGYQYNTQRFSLGVQRTQRTDDYASLGTLGAGSTGLGLESNQLNLSGSLGAAGTASLAYFDVLASDHQRTQFAALNYTKPVNSSNFISVNLNRSLVTDEYNLLLQWTLLVDSLSSMSVTGTRNSQGDGHQIQYSSSPSSSGGFGWNLSHARTEGLDDYNQASGTWRLRTTQLQAGVYAYGEQNTSWAGATGSVVVMDGGVFAANRINDAFAVVSTAGVENVPVRFENQMVGQTDENGHLLVTGVNSYYPSRFEIDMLNLPDYMEAQQSDQRVVIRAGSGAVLRFDIAQIRAASITLVDENGRPLPMGQLVQHAGTGQTAVLGWDGQVYFEGLSTENELLIRNADRSTCRVRFTLPSDAPGVQRIGPLVCRSQTTLPRLSDGGSPDPATMRAFVAGAFR